jgi:hypothetical protein
MKCCCLLGICCVNVKLLGLIALIIRYYFFTDKDDTAGSYRLGLPGYVAETVELASKFDRSKWYGALLELRCSSPLRPRLRP